MAHCLHWVACTATLTDTGAINLARCIQPVGKLVSVACVIFTLANVKIKEKADEKKPNGKAIHKYPFFTHNL